MPKDKNKPVTLTFQAKHVKMEKNKDGDEQYTVEVVSPIDFFTDAFVKDETLNEFLQDPGTKRYIAKIIGVKGLLATYPKDDVLNEVTWDYVKQFFFDHIDQEEILNHIGFEKIKEHFKDKIQVPKESKNAPKNDINTVGSKSILEALNESEGQNP